MLEFGLLGLVGVCVLALLSGPICNVLEDRFVYRDEGFGRALREFHDDRRRRGLTFAQRMDELYLREEFARLRREASESVSQNPADWFDRLHSAKTAALSRVSQQQPQLYAAFASTISELPFNHILYPRECKMVDQLTYRSKAAVQPNQDLLAALTIVRPS